MWIFLDVIFLFWIIFFGLSCDLFFSMVGVLIYIFMGVNKFCIIILWFVIILFFGRNIFDFGLIMLEYFIICWFDVELLKDLFINEIVFLGV